MRTLVTGATGFIGSHLVEYLIKKGHKVRVLVRKKEFEKRPFDRIDSIKLINQLNVEICFGDLLDNNSLKKCVKNIDVIFHLAAIARPMAIPRKKYFEINEKGTKNLLEACKRQKNLKKK